MEREHLDILFVDETHLKQGSNENMPLIDPWNPFYLKRYGFKKGRRLIGPKIRTAELSGIQKWRGQIGSTAKEF